MLQIILPQDAAVNMIKNIIIFKWKLFVQISAIVASPVNVAQIAVFIYTYDKMSSSSISKIFTNWHGFANIFHNLCGGQVNNN